MHSVGMLQLLRNVYDCFSAFHYHTSDLKYVSWLYMCALYCWNSFVPRPFPPPVFDRLQYAKMEGEELGDLIMCMMSGRQSVDRWGAVRDCCNSQTL